MVTRTSQEMATKGWWQTGVHKFRAEFGAGEESVRETGDGCGECRATTPQPDLPSGKKNAI